MMKLLSKVCPKCKLQKLLSAFGKNKSTKDGVQYNCKDCAKIYSQQYRLDNKEKESARSNKYYQENREKVLANSKQWAIANRERKTANGKKLRQRNPERYASYGKKWNTENPEKRNISMRYFGAIQRDKKKGFDTCTKEEFLKILDIGACYYCGLSGKIGVDRIDNSKGHVVGNMLPCCGDCNRIRSDIFTVEEMKSILGPSIALIRKNRSR